MLFETCPEWAVRGCSRGPPHAMDESNRSEFIGVWNIDVIVTMILLLASTISSRSVCSNSGEARGWWMGSDGICLHP